MDIAFDFSDVVDEFNLIRSQADTLVQAAVDAVTQEVYRQWQIAAKSKLRTTRNDYIRAIQIVEDGPFANIIMLNPAFKMALMIEDGIGAYDMKEGFRKSSKVKMNGKGGWYLTIPFRIGTPGTVGDMFNGSMPTDIYQLAKQLSASITSKGGGTVQSGSKLVVPGDNANSSPRTRPTIFNPQTGLVQYPAYTHKTNIYQGMGKFQAQYDKTNQNTYKTFRRVGSASDPNSWIHKGIVAHNLADTALQNTDFETIKDNAITSALTNLGF